MLQTALIVIGAFFGGVLAGALLNELFDFVIDQLFRSKEDK